MLSPFLFPTLHTYWSPKSSSRLTLWWSPCGRSTSKMGGSTNVTHTGRARQPRGGGWTTTSTRGTPSTTTRWQAQTPSHAPSMPPTPTTLTTPTAKATDQEGQRDTWTIAYRTAVSIPAGRKVLAECKSSSLKVCTLKPIRASFPQFEKP